MKETINNNKKKENKKIKNKETERNIKDFRKRLNSNGT